MKIYQRGLFVFDKDLRLHDQPALVDASNKCERLLCIYILPVDLFQPTQYSLTPMGNMRWRFLHESLTCLKGKLNALGHNLLIVKGEPVEVLSDLSQQYHLDAIFASRYAGSYESRRWIHLQRRFPLLDIHLIDSHTLFLMQQVDLNEPFYSSFSQFRKAVASFHYHKPISSVNKLAAPLPLDLDWNDSDLPPLKDEANIVEGGEDAALEHMMSYFSHDYASYYKLTRNDLDGWNRSSKFSFWLSNGCLSIRLLHEKLHDFEAEHGENESTRHLHFELLWREFFQWYAHYYQHSLFVFSGIQNKRPLTSFYPGAFRQWLEGKTPWPLVNALMHQLTTTGYMSNRGRQITASCLVNELGVDWRAGAYAFEHYLLDYDVASNWGNWQYIAGVGSDPRGGRHFNIEKQTQIYDPNGDFIKYWQGESGYAQYTVDAADWPLNPKKPNG